MSAPRVYSAYPSIHPRSAICPQSRNSRVRGVRHLRGASDQEAGEDGEEADRAGRLPQGRQGWGRGWGLVEFTGSWVWGREWLLASKQGEDKLEEKLCILSNDIAACLFVWIDQSSLFLAALPSRSLFNVSMPSFNTCFTGVFGRTSPPPLPEIIFWAGRPLLTPSQWL